MPRLAVLSILMAAIFAAAANSTDPEVLFHLVKIGMSRSQVEAHFGVFKGSSLDYEPGDRMIILDEDDKVSADISPSYLGDHKAANGDVRRFPGSTRREVIAILGLPAKECVSYELLSNDGSYVFCFANDKLISKRFLPAPPPPPIPSISFRCISMVFFVTDSPSVSPQGRDTLDRFAKDCLPKKKETIVIWGHWDGGDTPDANLTISSARAEVVRDYLVSIGVRAESILVEAYGDTKPLAPKKDMQNRRVEVFMR